jgi:translation elongation factor P/translation initiation factor 5A
MTKLKPGDRVDCRVKASTIVSPYRSYDEIKTFEIVAIDDHYYYLKDTKVADQYRIKKLGIDKKFLDENIVHIQENMIANVQTTLDGMACKVCKEFYPYAEGNQEDGTLICYSCRQNPYH